MYEQEKQELGAFAIFIALISLIISLIAFIDTGCSTHPYHFEQGGNDAGTDSHIQEDSDTWSDTGSEENPDAGTDGDADSDTESDTWTEPDTASDSDSETETHSDPYECTGILIDGACWFLAEEETGCDVHCAQHGALFDPATCGLFAQTELNCNAIMDALEVPDWTFYACDCEGMGCHTLNESRGLSDTCDSSSFGIQRRRACACTF